MFKIDAKAHKMFAIGDRVTVTYCPDYPAVVGKGGVVREVDSDIEDDRPYRVKVDGECLLWCNAEAITTTKPHKHCELIKRWAEGSDVVSWQPFSETWSIIITHPDWSVDTIYAVKGLEPNMTAPSRKEELWIIRYKNGEYGCHFKTEAECKAFLAVYSGSAGGKAVLLQEVVPK